MLYATIRMRNGNACPLIYQESPDTIEVVFKTDRGFAALIRRVIRYCLNNNIPFDRNELGKIAKTPRKMESADLYWDMDDF
ncbi:MAG: hypothetical protein RJA61_462 [Candidatus Parcubacteria bacterium]|jgi:hypothetical protein